ncbi:hypothetical protein [Candidatus Symbiopectobacterium sp. 'North America']|uniref:hypothetical protein n=1 Tax=Candidatus Symbiopectobacterium sp. 'North America' TaxID=2794574 RepID=UPI0018CB52C1|nr:hypothetical protein [Candidatus Symbiopectobacterium sp. 'North America']
MELKPVCLHLDNLQSSSNELTCIPDYLPQTITHLKLNNNNITTILEKITSLNDGMEIDLKNNKLSVKEKSTIINLQTSEKL